VEQPLGVKGGLLGSEVMNLGVATPGLVGGLILRVATWS
jgi:hypothetical protein